MNTVKILKEEFKIVKKGSFIGFNDYEIRGDITVIFLHTRKGEVFETIIDTEDLQYIKELSLRDKLHWHVRYAPNTGTYYAMATKRIECGDGSTKGESVYLHIELINPEHDKTIYVDHVNHDTLYNRKINLRRTINRKNLSHRKCMNKIDMGRI